MARKNESYYDGEVLLAEKSWESSSGHNATDIRLYIRCYSDGRVRFKEVVDECNLYRPSTSVVETQWEFCVEELIDIAKSKGRRVI